jgi:hypothetical protein
MLFGLRLLQETEQLDAALLNFGEGGDVWPTDASGCLS